ncbi:hypothetical protein GKZ28_25925 [Clostridium chromiireducens]|uniref:Uncharacterized protein n=1 Tax=Clostridium chromiireducens TaxID=225345 RepID=A0A964RSG3_9CLOT|nr:ABC-three component system middle component 1 [Clostridium chromiireducens]MVX67094.1 hypothetical protein [Clostridium chromiireducens]
MLEIDEKALSLLEKSSRFDKYSNITCWKEEHNSLPIYIFSIELDKENDLENIWEKVNNDIALYFQSEIENEVSRWNIYIFFLVKGNVRPIIKYKIEQDKYCARKIVLDNYMHQENISECIEKRLFRLGIQEEVINNEESLLEKISQKNGELVKIIKLNSDIKIIAQQYLEVQK